MTRLLCETHGREDEADIRSNAERYRQLGESVLVVSGRLTSDRYVCDRCNKQLARGAPAWLIAAFTRRVAEGLTDYDFGYEREYFSMTKADTATVYGADWPDDSISHRRPSYPRRKPDKSRPVCASDFPRPK